MPLLSRRDVATYDLGKTLQFRVTRKQGWIEEFALFIVLISLFWQANRSHIWFWLAAAVLGAIGYIADKLQGDQVELIVTATEITATGNLGNLFSTSKTLVTRSITSIGYDPGGEDQVPGLYARQGLQTTRLIPNLSEPQCLEIATCIYSHFPNIPDEHTNPDSWLFGKQSDLISLGLTNKRNLK